MNNTSKKLFQSILKNSKQNPFKYFTRKKSVEKSIPIEKFDQIDHSTDQFWIYDPLVLFKNGNFYRFFPTKGMTLNQVLNSLTLLMIIIFVILLLFVSDYRYALIPLIIIVILVFIYFIEQSRRRKRFENFDQSRDDADDDNEDEAECRLIPDLAECNAEECQMPTRSNPFMNVTMADLMNCPKRPPACPIESDLINDKLQKFLNQNLAKDANDIYHKNYAERSFFTTPGASIPNDQTGFANWLYKTPETCKENQSNCLRYVDIRYSRLNPELDRFEVCGDGVL